MVQGGRSDSHLLLWRRAVVVCKSAVPFVRITCCPLTSQSNNKPIQGPGFIDSFVCNCSDCHKITASMFASNFTIADTHLKHLRGRENLTSYSQSCTVASGNTMTNYFCSTCGTLMYRVGSAFPGMSILRIGTVDDFHLHETKLRPQVEQFTKHRVGWLNGLEGISHFEGERVRP